MCHVYKFLAVLLVILQCSCDQSVPSDDKPNKKVNTVIQKPNTSTASGSTVDNSTKISLSVTEVSLDSNVTSVVNGTLHARTMVERLGLDTGAVKRTFYVVATLTGVVLLYFTFRGIRTLRRRRHKPQRYGLLADSKEMKHFRDDEEDYSDEGEEDATLFDARKHRPSNKRGP